MIIKTLKDLRLNFNLGMVAFVVHRITGLGLVAYLILHILSLSTALKGESSFNQTMAQYNAPLFHFFEYLLLLAVGAHCFNGLRVTLADFFDLTNHHKQLLGIGVILMLIIGAVSIKIFMPELF